MKKAIVLSVLILAAPAAPLLAEVVGTGTPASCHEAAFNAALAAIRLGGGDITFNCGGPATINFTSEKIFYNPGAPSVVYNVDGGGLITLNGQGITRLFLHLSGTLNLANITMTGGRARGAEDGASGGAIRSDRNPSQVPVAIGLNLNNVTFTNNVTELTVAPTPPFLAFDYGGAAVFTRLAYLNVVNCRFTNNTAINTGGGAIHGRSSGIAISGSLFSTNVSNGGGFGGAMHVDGASPFGTNGVIQITTTTFSGNTALQQGGAIFFYLHPGKAESIVLDTVNVLGNRVVDSGNIWFVGNRGWGGGMAGNNGSLIVRNSTFAGNTVRGRIAVNGGGFGGGVSATQSDAVTIVNSTFSGNQAFGSSSDSGGGGVLILDNAQPFQITHSTITLNSAGAYAGGLHSLANGVLTNSIVSGNTSPSSTQCSFQVSNGGGALQFPDSTPRCANAILVVNPLLGSLASNGGFTQTHHPQPGSPVINAVGCAAATDQRGFARPQGGGCEIGSVEVSCSALSVNPLTLPTGRIGVPYSQTFSASGGASPFTLSRTGTLPTGLTFNPATGILSGTPTQAGGFVITVTASDAFTCTAGRNYNLAIASSVAVNPVALVVDAVGNGVLEPNQTVVMDPSWINQTAGAVPLTGVLSSFLGPAGPTYQIIDGVASYGTIPAGATARCSTATGNCHALHIGATVRPAVHWDASVFEALSTGGPKAWTLHVGGSFTDVPAASPFFGFVETLLHRGITSGCDGSSYCPGSAVTRAQMAVFLLRSKEGGAYAPPPCVAQQFDDVPCSLQFAEWINELAARGVTSGCAPDNYCPGGTVTRRQMAAFLLRTKEGSTYTPPPATGIFDDVPVGAQFADFIEELAARGITGGCQASPPLFCPDAGVTRSQMAAFLTRTFGLTLYGP